MCPLQVLQPKTRGASSTSTYPRQTLVPHNDGLYHQHASFLWILTIVDRFSKMCRLVALPKLPSTIELSDILIQELFCFTGIPEDIVSNRGPQFASRVFREFCRNITLSLTSAYHPHSNGLAECMNHKVSKALRLPVQTDPTKWTSLV